MNNGEYKESLRCPRCEGFLFDAWYAAFGRDMEFYKNLRMKKCINCSRIWRMVKDEIQEFPDREFDERIKLLQAGRR
ncbi:MAG: hypothetical protein AB1553_05665 [Nitrospirota bacterium]